MDTPVTANDEKALEIFLSADCLRMEVERLIEGSQLEIKPGTVAGGSFCGIHPGRSLEENAIAKVGAAKVPTSPRDPGRPSGQAAGPKRGLRDSDEDLLTRIVSGDEVALGDVYDRYRGLLRSVSRHILQDAGAVEEVVQDTFYQLWRLAGSFDAARGTLGCWLLVIARNRSIDRVRRRVAVVEEQASATQLGSVLDIESFVAKNELTRSVRAALRVLPEGQRVAVELAYFEGFTQSEIAKRTGEPLGTVKTRLRTALASLKAYFQAQQSVRLPSDVHIGGQSF
jgi:RNA polymerase sigma-70 factor (ECF subfamily)